MSLFKMDLYKTAARSLAGLLNLMLALMLFMLSPTAMAANFSIDQSGTAMTGLWWNQNETGWGTSLTHQYGVIFVPLYTYDASHNPVWYVASNCSVSANGCSGDLYAVKGGSAPTSPWNGANVALTAAGKLNLVFTDANTGSMSYSINGVSGSKAIVRNVFVQGTTPAATDYSPLFIPMTPMDSQNGMWRLIAR
ncbi:hypothetical protein JZU56_02185 [bacterium]|nr:hypothetical protein [bacterium]